MQPDVTYCILRPGPVLVTWRKAQILITNYDFFRTHVDDLIALEPDVVVMDESHKIKNPHARQAKMAHKLAKVARFRLALTGTPIGNRPLDLWSQFRFIKPDLLDDKFKDFKQNYAVWGGFGGFELRKYKNLRGLARLIHPYTRSLRKEDLAELPAKNFIEVPIDLPHSAKKLYKQMEEEFVAYVNEETTISAPIVLAKLAKLSQISGGFIHDTETDADFLLHTAKLDAVSEIVSELKEAGTERVVIFARFLWELKSIRERLTDWCVYQISGEIPQKGRDLAIKLFNRDGGVMLCQTSSGSAGINLQAANYCIFYSLNYSLIDYLQAQDRIHRIGQKKPCFYHVLLAKGTIDRRVYNILKQKKDVSDEVINLVEDIKKGKLV